MTNYYKSEIHSKAKQEALERYKDRPESHLHVFLNIYNKIREDAIRDKDSRWKIPSEEGKLCVKEHIKLIRLALESKKPIRPVVIGCKPAIMGTKTNK